MTREQWRLVWRICEAARSLPQAERTDFVHSNAPDVEIESQVVALLNEPNLSVAASWDPLYKAGPDRSIGGGRATTLTPESTRTGLNIGRYVVEEVLGRGAAGEVYSARDVELNRRVALKFLSPASLNAGLLVGGFMREARAASALNHPGIVTVHEVIQSESGLAIVMEYVDGTPLREVCGEPMQPPAVARVGLQIAKALAAAHSHGIIHRDIKPENIMLRADGYLKVVDFGVAKDARGSEKSLSAGLLVGTFRYMSPEQTRGEVLTPATDVFSLGLVLYELSTGRHPFATAGVLETVRAITSADPAPPSAVRPEIPKALDSLIRKMLAKSKEARPSAAEVAERFEEILQTAPAPSNTRWVIAAVVTVMMAVLALVWNFRRTENANPIPVPLTAQAGWESSPQISPDGQSIVYAWGSLGHWPTHIYIAGIEQQAPVMVVKAAAGEKVGVPVWSPDGNRVTYKKEFSTGRGAIWSVSADGQHHHKLKDLSRGDLSSGLSLSPDGSTLLYSDSKAIPEDQFSVRSLNLRTMAERTLTSPPGDYWGDWDPKFSPDGRTIAFKRVKSFWGDYIYTMPAEGGPARQVTREEQISIWGHAWMPGGDLLVSCQLGGIVHGLWRIPVNHSDKPQALFVTGVNAVTPAVSADGTRIAWVNRINDHNIYSIPIRGGKPSKIVATTEYESSPALAPDGRLAYVSHRSGSAEIWIGAADGSNAVRVTNLRKGSTAYLAWSPDGTRLLFESSADGNSGIFSIECPPKIAECGSPSRISPKMHPAIGPSWSADGKFVYSVTGERVYPQIWKRPAAGGNAVQVAGSVGHRPQESRDGKWIYYAKPEQTMETVTIWRIPVADGTDTQVKEELVVGPPYRPSEYWTLANSEVVFFDRGNNSNAPAFRAYHTVTTQVRTIVELDENDGQHPAVSPDGRTLFYSHLDQSGSNIMVARLSR